MTRRPLQELRKLTLHLNGAGREFWTVQGIYGFIFAHPSLQELHMSSANLPRNTTELIPRGSKTPLKQLTLDECNITVEALQSILSYPTGLQYLYIGENLYSLDEERYPAGQDYNQLCEREPAAFIAALSQQQHSLETLVYSPQIIPFPRLARPATAGLSLNAFCQLCEVDLPQPCRILRNLLASDLTAPPKLTKLSASGLRYEWLFDFEDVGPNSEPGMRVPSVIQNAASALPNLKELVLCFERLYLSTDTTTGFPGDMNIATAGKFLQQRGVTLRILQEPSRTSCVRPILYGEAEKEDTLVYTNDDVGFRPSSRVRPGPHRDELVNEESGGDSYAGNESEDWEDDDEEDESSE
ncbi:hypothetical protein LTR36_005714 [Oleoguttula mirabilis]|uniref:Uncharacterized protein n=1 Tax=Oleoguttula mirabilis TaxID=1507867 RepID=A0AAV9JF23_9PEZI|nr:hypothetical protein LTR36_005714 [Oleoguttula mirabilis]